MKWLPIESAPKDGTRFYALVDGLPYEAYFDEYERFIRITHTDHATGKSWIIHKIDGKELLELASEGEPTIYKRSHLIYQNGFKHNPTHWMPLPPKPCQD